jgi:hypothetical protein
MPEVLQSKTAGQRLSSTGPQAPERHWDQVALKFLLKNSPWTWARQWTRAPDGGDLNVNTLFSTVRHGTACGAHFAVSP